MKVYIVEKTTKAEIRLKEQNGKAQTLGEN